MIASRAPGHAHAGAVDLAVMLPDDLLLLAFRDELLEPIERREGLAQDFHHPHRKRISGGGSERPMKLYVVLDIVINRDVNDPRKSRVTRSLLWVKLRRTQCEHMFSASPRTRTSLDGFGMSHSGQELTSIIAQARLAGEYPQSIHISGTSDIGPPGEANESAMLFDG
jgi:hypothetical protein